MRQNALTSAADDGRSRRYAAVPLETAALRSEQAMNDAPPPQRRSRPLYEDVTFQVVVGMALGVAVGAIWRGAVRMPCGKLVVCSRKPTS